MTSVPHAGAFVPQTLEERFLCGGIGVTPSEDLASLFEELGEERAWRLCEDNLVTPILGRRLSERLKPDALPGRWVEAYEEMRDRISAYLDALDRVAVLLDAEGIPLVALKNSGIARAIYTDTGQVPMGDVDTMVRRSQFRQAHEVLEANGYRIAAPNALEQADVEYGYAKGGSEYETTLPDGRNLWFELQWRPVDGRFLRPDQEPSADDLMDRSIPIDGSKIRLLSPEDNLLQVCLHTAKHSYVRSPGFRLHLDVERIVHGQEIDWDVFVKRVLHHQVKTPVYLALWMPMELLGTPIPPQVLQAIAPSSAKLKVMSQWIRRAGIYRPEDSKFGRLEYIAFVSSLYDDVPGFLRGVFPEDAWMRDRYDLKDDAWVLPWHARRIVDLALRRMKT